MTNDAPSPADSRPDAADHGAGCGTPANSGAWCVLHTAFGQGAHFLHTWAAWRADPLRPRHLHYVALAPQAPLWAGVPHPAPASSVPDELAQALQAQCGGLVPGQHRLVFEGGQVLLTLCIGPSQALLREQQFEADVVVLAPPPGQPDLWDGWDDWAVKALVRCCRRGTQLTLWQPQPGVQHSLRQCGFVLQDVADDRQPQHGVFDPRWELKTTREPWRRARAAPQSCAVIGAGLAGASVAASLARRGWQVQVLDLADHPAAGASGLPVGLAVPHVSADDCVLSRLSRSGVRLSLQQAHQLLTVGQDWAPSGVQEYLFDVHAPQPTRWHGHAAWIKPGALVRAWLQQPGIQFRGGIQVQNLQRSAAGWTLLDPAGRAITTVARVVLANATGALPLLQRVQAAQPALALGLHQLPAVYGVRGLVSWAAHDVPETRPFPPGPVNGSGSLIPQVPLDGGPCWFVGASYQPLGQPEWPDDKNHGANALRLEKLQPALFEVLTPVLEAGALQAWKGVRCVTADRLPLLGSLQDEDQSLWVCAGMGSRGLSFAPLCAELLAAQWAGEPLPIEASLAQALHARRRRGDNSEPLPPG
ncbi:MAG: FAD-dependent oxidoreductase [Rhodoferax sp.]|nr:FAD-dependent oxidoreductase [Rhodoferax sp.]MDP3654827.1 FAD-dependent oxidoreductase [Rhodoferax sp.]